MGEFVAQCLLLSLFTARFAWWQTFSSSPSFLNIQGQLAGHCWCSSFFPRTVRDWNGLPSETIQASTLDTFSRRVSSLHIWTNLSVFVLFMLGFSTAVSSYFLLIFFFSCLPHFYSFFLPWQPACRSSAIFCNVQNTNYGLPVNLECSKEEEEGGH